MLKMQAEARLRAALRPESRPALSDDQVTVLLASHGDDTTAADGALEWTGSLAAAAAEGWGWKAAAVATDFSFSADGASYNKGEVYAQCLEMQAMYAAQTQGSGNGGPVLDFQGLVVNG